MSDVQVDEPPVIRVENVERSFGRVRVLTDVSLDVRRGETVVVLGASGGGKSTLLKVMLGFLPPDAGCVRIDGEDIYAIGARGLDRVRRRFGVMFQQGALLNSLTVGENVALPLRYHTRLDPETVDTMVKIKLHQVGILHAKDRRPAELSGGMLKRAAVARALALDPKILFYDEPSAGLDPIATRRLDELINLLKSTMRIASVVVTHDLPSMSRIADRVVLLDRGRVRFTGTPLQLHASDDPFVQGFLSGDQQDSIAERDDQDRFFNDLLM